MYLSGFSYLLFDLSPWYDLHGRQGAFKKKFDFTYIYISVDYVFFLFHIKKMFL